jgi:spore coat polysaccharide biosynthesis protein SpsF
MNPSASQAQTLALIQARMSSTRLPGKVTAMLDGLPMIVFMVERVRRARRLDATIVVTSTDPSDDPLVEVCEAHGIEVCRGDLNDVLSRYHSAVVGKAAKVLVRLTGDCPLIDPSVIDAVVAARAEHGVDYASNVDPPTFPDGLDVECFTREALDRAFVEASDGPQREHVTLWMRSAAAALKRHNCSSVVDASPIRWTVDHPNDLEVVRALVAKTANARSADMFDFLRSLAQHPELLDANRHQRNESLQRSLAAHAGAA